MSRRSLPGLAAAALASLLTGCAADETAPATDYTESLPASGQAWFRTYCASCHGLDARGGGPAGEALRTPPPDLTRIALRHGSFDAPGVARWIDGRTPVGAHGPREMPVWGRRFDDRTGESIAEETRLAPGAIFLIVEYLRSVQRGPASD